MIPEWESTYKVNLDMELFPFKIVENEKKKGGTKFGV
jgi:hypothetical protein